MLSGGLAGRSPTPLEDVERYQIEDLIRMGVKDVELFRVALTAPSAITQDKTIAASFDRLEYLGDAAVSLAFRSWVFGRYAWQQFSRHRAPMWARWMCRSPTMYACVTVDRCCHALCMVWHRCLHSGMVSSGCMQSVPMVGLFDIVRDLDRLSLAVPQLHGMNIEVSRDTE